MSTTDPYPASQTARMSTELASLSSPTEQNATIPSNSASSTTSPKISTTKSTQPTTETTTTATETTTETAATTTTATTTTTTTSATTTASTSSTGALVGTTCMELALEGERLCKTGDFKNGVRYFEEAIRVGTNDDRTLSAIYSQLGNAYFYMEDFQKALEYHKHDVALVHNIGDEVAEAKACGNLGNTFKMLGKYDEAAVYCKRYLEISKKLNDKIGEGRALYNLGNVYHTQGKRMIGTSEQEPGELSPDIKSSLQKAIDYYEQNLKVVSELKDNASMGRAYGNLGNTHYLLGNFESAVECHKERLKLARLTNDKSAERRAYLNLGNANVFLGNFPEAIENYSATLRLAQELQDRYTEAHSCYSLANTYTFLRDYKSAVAYHLKYLELIKEFDDKLGEGRACWSLVNIYQMVNDPESALFYAERHREIAERLGDKAGLASANLNIEELEEIISQKQAAQLVCQQQQRHQYQHQQNSLGLAESTGSGSRETGGRFGPTSTLTSGAISEGGKFRLTPDKRQEQEQRRFKKQLNSSLAADIDGLAARRKGRGACKSSSNERLFDMIAHFQSGRIDDQRCEMLHRPTLGTEIKTIAGSASASSNVTTGTSRSDEKENLASNSTNGISNLITNVKRASQPSMPNPMTAVTAAASAIKATYRKASLVAYPNAPSAGGYTSSILPAQAQRRPSVSAEHRDQLFDLIASSQNHRMDEQRASLPTLAQANGVLKNPMNAGFLSRGYTVDPSNSADVEPVSSSHAPSTSSNRHQTDAENLPATIRDTSRHPRLQRHYQTVDASKTPGHDEKFIDSLMKYQSTRFNDQRSEFPNRAGNLYSHGTDQKPGVKGKAQDDNFFNLIVKFQSDRIDDQRSAPPARSKNV